MKVTLHCVGCGEYVCQAEPGAVLAIACMCGAGAPILEGEGICAPPLALVRMVSRGRQASPPHLEYFLGYSDHESEAKTAVLQVLRRLGAISQAECRGKRCKGAYQRGREQWQQYREERQALDLQERERDYRIVEIGEP